MNRMEGDSVWGGLKAQHSVQSVEAFGGRRDGHEHVGDFTLQCRTAGKASLVGLTLMVVTANAEC